MALARSYKLGSLRRTEFARKVGVHPSTLDVWCRRLRKEGEPEAVTAEFTEVTVTEVPEPSIQPDVEVELPFGVTLRFFGT